MPAPAKNSPNPCTPVLEAVARDLEKASSGIVKVKPVVTVGKTNSSGKSPAPVALWLAGPDKKPVTTEVVSFTVDSPENFATRC